ncbi:hypothetical protein E4U32_000341 [Claviceps aff. humidiphila group G2b]|nr:hypothetical protein E4U32_000341 [Claviceps aff. humidiphila group G2b]
MLELTICSTINYDDKSLQIRKKDMNGIKFAAALWITKRSVAEGSVAFAEGCASERLLVRAPPPLAGRLSVVLPTQGSKGQCYKKLSTSSQPSGIGSKVESPQTST